MDEKFENPEELVDNEESGILIEEENEDGAIQISDDVMISVIRHYTLTVDGVVSFAHKSLATGLADVFRKKTSDESIRLEKVGDAVNVSVILILQFGESVPQVAQGVQEIVRTKVEELTGKRVNRVDVKVQDLAMKAAKDEEATDTNVGIEVVD